MTDSVTDSVTGLAVLDDLLDGNARFRNGVSEHCTDRLERRLACVDVQRPSVAVLSCADARVDPEIVFDAALGDVFSVRIAGSLATDEAIASLRYAVDQLDVRTVIVLGHEGCGAVAAAVAGDTPPALEPLVAPIRTAVSDGVDGTDPVRDNTCAQAHRVRRHFGDHVTVTGAVYSASTGRVELTPISLHHESEAPQMTIHQTSAPDAPTAVRLRPAEVQQLLAAEPATRLIDVRTAGEFESGHISGAYNVPLDTLSEHRTEIASLAAPVVLVCQSGARAAKAEDTLRAAGMSNIRILEGGMSAWSTSGAPVRTVKARWGLERQVRLVAGSIVLAAIVVSIWVPAARFVAGFIGAGLTFAALTNTCAMGMLLAKLPYNRGAACDIDDVVRRLRVEAAAR